MNYNIIPLSERSMKSTMVLCLFILFSIRLIFVCEAVYGAPLPKREQGVPIEVWSLLLGKSHMSKEIQDIRERLDEKPVATYYLSGSDRTEACFTHTFQDAGLTMKFDEDGKLNGIIFNFISKPNFKCFMGAVYGKLSSADDPVAVEKKLGKPDEVSEGFGVAGGLYDYQKLGIQIRFTAPLANPVQPKVASVAIYDPKQPK